MPGRNEFGVHHAAGRIKQLHIVEHVDPSHAFALNVPRRAKSAAGEIVCDKRVRFPRGYLARDLMARTQIAQMSPESLRRIRGKPNDVRTPNAHLVSGFLQQARLLKRHATRATS